MPRDYPDECPHKPGDRLYSYGSYYRGENPHEVAAVLKGEEAKPWKWLVVLRQYGKRKQWWHYSIETPLVFEGGGTVMYFRSKEAVRAEVEKNR